MSFNIESAKDAVQKKQLEIRTGDGLTHALLRASLGQEAESKGWKELQADFKKLTAEQREQIMSLATELSGKEQPFYRPESGIKSHTVDTKKYNAQDVIHVSIKTGGKSVKSRKGTDVSSDSGNTASPGSTNHKVVHSKEHNQAGTATGQQNAVNLRGTGYQQANNSPQDTIEPTKKDVGKILASFEIRLKGIQESLNNNKKYRDENTGFFNVLADDLVNLAGGEPGKAIYGRNHQRIKDQANETIKHLDTNLKGVFLSNTERDQYLKIRSELEKTLGHTLGEPNPFITIKNSVMDTPNTVVNAVKGTGGGIVGTVETTYEAIKGIFDLTIFATRYTGSFIGEYMGVNPEYKNKMDSEIKKIWETIKEMNFTKEQVLGALSQGFDQIKGDPYAIGKLAGIVIGILLPMKGAGVLNDMVRGRKVVVQTAESAVETAIKIGKPAEIAAAKLTAKVATKQANLWKVGEFILNGPVEIAIGEALSKSFRVASGAIRGGVSAKNIKTVEQSIEDFSDAAKNETNPEKLKYLQEAKESLEGEKNKMTRQYANGNNDISSSKMSSMELRYGKNKDGTVNKNHTEQGKFNERGELLEGTKEFQSQYGVTTYTGKFNQQGRIIEGEKRIIGRTYPTQTVETGKFDDGILLEGKRIFKAEDRFEQETGMFFTSGPQSGYLKDGTRSGKYKDNDRYSYVVQNGDYGPEKNTRYGKNTDGTIDFKHQERGEFSEDGYLIRGVRRYQKKDGRIITESGEFDANQLVKGEANVRYPDGRVERYDLENYGIIGTRPKKDNSLGRPPSNTEMAQDPILGQQSIRREVSAQNNMAYRDAIPNSSMKEGRILEMQNARRIEQIQNPTITETPQISSKLDQGIQSKIDESIIGKSTPKRPKMLSEQEVFAQKVVNHNPNVGTQGNTIVDQYKKGKIDTNTERTARYLDEIERTFAPTRSEVRGKNTFLSLGKDYTVERRGLMDFILTDHTTNKRYEGLKSREIVKEFISDPRKGQIYDIEKQILGGNASKMSELAKIEGRNTADYRVEGGKIIRRSNGVIWNDPGFSRPI